MCCETCQYKYLCANAKPSCFVPKNPVAPYVPYVPYWPVEPNQPYYYLTTTTGSNITMEHIPSTSIT